MAELTKEERSAIGARSRRKGATNEQQLARAFTAWWGSEVRRTPMSGAYGRTWALAGDLMFTREDPFPFHVEAKAREKWEMEHLFEPERTGPVLGWWGETESEAEYQKCFPMLIFTRNQRAQFVMIPYAVLKKLDDLEQQSAHLLVPWPGGPIAVVRLIDFFERVAPDTVRELREPDVRHRSDQEIDFS